MEDPKQANHSRFLLAVVLSMAVLFGYQYFFAPKPTDNANTNSNTANTNTAPAPTPAQTPVQQAQSVPVANKNPNRQISIKTPLYEVTLDSLGAQATSWILLKNKSTNGEKMLYADGSTPDNNKPLQLISPEALTYVPRQTPFRLSTGDANLDLSLNDNNYTISVTESVIELQAGQEKQIDFTLTDGAGVEVTKTFRFRADDYISDVGVKLTRNGQQIPAKIAIGATIGDQAIAKHSFYHIESEAIGRVAGTVQRYPGASFTYQNNQAALNFDGPIDWAGTGDTYFAQAAIPT